MDNENNDLFTHHLFCSGLDPGKQRAKGNYFLRMQKGRTDKTKEEAQNLGRYIDRGRGTVVLCVTTHFKCGVVLRTCGCIGGWSINVNLLKTK